MRDRSPAYAAAPDLEPGRAELDQPVADLFAEDDGLCHLRDDAIESPWTSLCRVSPTWKVAKHGAAGSEPGPYCSGCGRPRCPECAALWRARSAA